MSAFKRISVDPAVCLGQACVHGTRITVSLILRLLAGGETPQEIVGAYPELKLDDIRQALSYAAWLASDRLLIAPSA